MFTTANQVKTAVTPLSPVPLAAPTARQPKARHSRRVIQAIALLPHGLYALFSDETSRRALLLHAGYAVWLLIHGNGRH